MPRSHARGKSDEVGTLPLVPSRSHTVRFPPHPPQCAHWGTFPALPQLPFPGLLRDSPRRRRLREVRPAFFFQVASRACSPLWLQTCHRHVCLTRRATGSGRPHFLKGKAFSHDRRRATARLAPTEERDVEDAVPYAGTGPLFSLKLKTKN